MSESPPALLTTADGVPLKVSLRRAVRRSKVKAFLLVSPLLLFLVVAFVMPIFDMLWRSVDNPEVSTQLSRTVAALEGWDGESLPDEPVFAALVEDLREGQAARNLGLLSSRLNYEKSGMRSTITRTARSAHAAEPPYREALIEINATWGELDTWKLIEFNFNTRDPAEVNWYLRRNVGCNQPTADGKNWMFSASAKPGVIYVPPTAAAQAPEPSGIWFGLAVKGGGHFFLVGKDTLEGWLVSYDRYEDSFFMNVDGWRLGPGLGGSVGMALIIVTSLREPSGLHGHMIGGGDFEANLGGKWGTVAKAVDKLQPAMKALRTMKRATKGVIKVAEWEKTREVIKNAATALGMSLDAAEPQVYAFGIPGAGVGVELSLFYGVGTVQVHGVDLASRQPQVPAVGP